MRRMTRTCVFAAVMIAGTGMAGAQWKPCANIRNGIVTLHENGMVWTAPKWELKKMLGLNDPIRKIDNHGMCNEQTHEVTLCDPFAEQNDIPLECKGAH
jgi:hypothetical protein